VPVKTLTLNGELITAREDETILEAAREHNIDIPTLCHLEGLSAVGACRLCLVEVKGVNKLLPACITTVQEGMDVQTHTEKLQNYRRMIVELLFSERNHVCAVCVANGHCGLQDLGYELGIDHVTYPYLNPNIKPDASHERFIIDQNRCVLCTRCVRVCNEIEGAHVWDVGGRGMNSRIIADLGGPWGDSETCTSCGKCVHVCPTGTLSEKGRSVGEMEKHPNFLGFLLQVRNSLDRRE